jgi:hypothetical protein
MGLLAIVEHTALYHAPDGRIVFRPWGKRGKCYLVDPHTRRRFVRALKIHYSLLFLAPFTGILGNTLTGILIFFFVWLIASYVLYWWFSRGLPETDPPPRPSREEVHLALQAQSRAVGAPVFWVGTVLSACLTLVAGFLWAITSEFTMVLATLFFGLCTGTFVWRLTHLRKQRTSQAPQN